MKPFSLRIISWNISGLVIWLCTKNELLNIQPSKIFRCKTFVFFSLCLIKSHEKNSNEEIQEKELIAQGILSILNRESPRFLVERLNVQLAPTERIIDAS